MRREIRRFEVKCDRCSTTAIVETFKKELATIDLPTGWTVESDRESWCSQPTDFCPACDPKLGVNRKAVRDLTPASGVGRAPCVYPIK